MLMMVYLFHLYNSGSRRVMKPEESYSARDTLCRLEEELINLDEHPLVIIESLGHRLPHPRVREIYDVR
jgi:hypothetical protein